MLKISYSFIIIFKIGQNKNIFTCLITCTNNLRNVSKIMSQQNWCDRQLKSRFFLFFAGLDFLERRQSKVGFRKNHSRLFLSPKQLCAKTFAGPSERGGLRGFQPSHPHDRILEAEKLTGRKIGSLFSIGYTRLNKNECEIHSKVIVSQDYFDY